MATFKIEASGFTSIIDEGKTIKIIKKTLFDSFNPDILGLGNIETKSQHKNALSAIFDLQGFTNLCKQIDPHLAVPEFLSEFLKWIFSEIRNQIIAKKYELGYKTYSDLPFLSKYLGDGILFLWDTENMSDTQIQNVVVSLSMVCRKYQNIFLPSISKKIVTPPTKLRCGIARGIIYSVGNGNDFVGPCINMSARLQKLSSLSFCFSRRGIDPEKMADSFKKNIIVKKVDIRGIGEDELVCFSKIEYDNLSNSEKEKFKDA